MKNLKKLPTKQLEKFSTIFTQLGLVLVLFIVYLTLEHKTEQKQLAVVNFDAPKKVFIEPDQDIVFTREPKAKPKLKTPKQVFIPDSPIEKGDNNVVETITFEDPTKDEVQLNADDIIEIIDSPKIIEDVPYDFVEQTPIFKGCEGLSKEENKSCFEKKMNKFVQKNFDSGLASELGLRSGIHKIFTQFIIDQNGDVVDIRIRAPHPKLKSETLETIQKLPKFTPGKQNNNFVKVKYTLPITFRVD